METHIIKKKDLIEMLSRFDDDSKIIIEVQSGPNRDSAYINHVVNKGGQIVIECLD